MQMPYRWLTPAAPAAIALLQIDCALAEVLLAKTAETLPAVGTCRFLRIRDARGEVIDEVVVWRLSEAVLELGCHGGPGVRQAIQSRLDELLDLQSSLPASVDPAAKDVFADTQSARWRRLAQAASPAARDWLLVVDANHEQLPFPQEFCYRCPVVLLTGPSNAGKSTLLNAWCGHQRALVSDVAGTTRDLVAAEVVIHGWRMRIIDSAGLRATDDVIEQAGQSLVAQARERVDVVCWLEPGERPESEAIAADDVIIAGKSDQRGQVADWGISWSAPHATSEAAAQIALDQLSRAVLDRIGLPLSISDA